MATTEEKLAQSDNPDGLQWPSQWQILPILIIDHIEQPTSPRRIMDPQQSLFAAEWPVMSNDVVRRDSFGIQDRSATPTSPSNPPSSPNKLQKTHSNPPSSPLREDWTPTTTGDIRTSDAAFEKGTLTPQWTNASTGPLSPTWLNVNNRPASSSVVSDLKAPQHTTYHIYHKKSRRHYIATTKRRAKKPPKMCLCFRRKPKVDEKQRQEAIEKGLISKTSGHPESVLAEDWTYGSGLPGEDEEDEEGYFWHKPFSCRTWRRRRAKESTTPRDAKGKKVRTLRKGVSKEESVVVAELPKVMLWKRWKIVWTDSESRNDEAVQLERRESRWEMPDSDPNGYDGEGNEKKGRKKRLRKQKGEKTREVTELVWTKPFSKKCRQYDFKFGSLSFRWKGTSTVEGTGFWKSWLRYNHLKLVVRIPLADHPKDIAISDEGYKEVVLAKYTSSTKYCKAGILEMYDDVIAHVWKEYVLPQERLAMRRANGEKEKENGSFKYDRSPTSVKESQFWDALIATGMCMIIGEWEKRETIRQIIQALGTAGGAA